MPERLRERATRDPFAITPDPNVYVPRAATEFARKELLRCACNPAKTAALIGPPGLGKTLLLHLLAKEAPEDLQTVYLPYAALPPEELCGWALGLLNLPTTGDPIGALRAHTRDLHERRSSLLLLIDDADSMPIATARWLGDLVGDAGHRVRLAIAASDNAAGNRVLAAIGSNFDVIRLDDPMTESETSKYIAGRLALARLPDSIQARFDAPTVRLLHQISAGIPRRLHSAASGILQEAPSVAPESAERAGPAAETAAPVAAGQTLGVPREERRVADRRAEPEGVEVRVGPGGASNPKGRRAEDRVEVSPEPVETARGERDESAWDEAEALNEKAALAGAPPRAAAPPRVARAASRWKVFSGALFVVCAAVAIPAIRFLLAEPKPIERDRRSGDLGTSTREGLREPRRREVEAPIAPGERAGAIAGEEVGGIPVPAGTEGPLDVELSAVAPSAAEDPGPFAVQINATPWATVEVDGIDLGATPLANIPLRRGPHAFRVKLPDGRVIERTVEIDAERRFISFE